MNVYIDYVKYEAEKVELLKALNERGAQLAFTELKLKLAQADEKLARTEGKLALTEARLARTEVNLAWTGGILEKSRKECIEACWKRDRLEAELAETHYQLEREVEDREANAHKVVAYDKKLLSMDKWEKEEEEMRRKMPRLEK